MTEPLPSFVHNLGKTLDEMLEVSGVLRQDIESLVAACQHDWSSQPLRRMFVRAYWSMIEGEVFCTSSSLSVPVNWATKVLLQRSTYSCRRAV